MRDTDQKLVERLSDEKRRERNHQARDFLTRLAVDLDRAGKPNDARACEAIVDDILLPAYLDRRPPASDTAGVVAPEPLQYGELVDCLRECKKQIDVIVSDGAQSVDWQQWRDDLDELLLHVASPPAVETPKVKALEWKRAGDGGLSRAETVLGTYRVWTHAEANGNWFCNRDFGREEQGTVWPNEEEAKAAAQADYEQRIRSALE